MKVFVYGTLKKGGRFNSVFDEESFIGNATLNKHQMFAPPGRFFPHVIESDDEDKIIEGEVYEINQKTLQQLDWIEGYPDLYDRKKVEVSLDDKVVEVYMYYVTEKQQHIHDNKNEITNFVND